MAHQVRGFVLRLAARVNMNQLVTLGLALTTAIVTMGMPGGGGSGA